MLGDGGGFESVLAREGAVGVVVLASVVGDGVDDGYC